MLKKLIPLSFAFPLILVVSTATFAQEASKQDATSQNPAAAKTEKQSKKKGSQEARWEGVVVRSSQDKSTLTVRKTGTDAREKTIHYDNSTKWVSQEHGSKTVNDIDPSQVKDGDRVIARGTDEKGTFNATIISKRLTPLPGSRQ
jgi:hypothetical protein